MTKLEKIKSEEASGGFVALLFCVMFVAMAIVFHFCPLLVDDYEFLSYNYHSLGEAINYALCYGNGRFLGNLGAILLAPHSAIAAVFKALTVSLLCILLPKIFNATKKTTYLLSCLLILAVPEKMFAQVHAWNCGNVNYILPILLTIFCFLILKSESKGNFITILKCFGIFILGFCSQLFMEHNTLVNFLIAASLFIFLTVKRKIYGNKKCIITFFGMVATALGTIALLLIPKFFTGERTRDMSTYRGVGINSLYELRNNIIENSAKIMSHFAANFLLILVIGIITYYLLNVFLPKTKVAARLIIVLKTANIVCVCFDLMYCLFVKNLDISLSDQRQTLLKLTFVISMICIFEVIVFFISCFLCLRKKIRIISAIFMVLLACSLVPLLVINPIGERTSFLGTVILGLTVLYLFDKYFQKSFIASALKQRVALICSVAAVICCLFISFVYINGCAKSIDMYIASEMDKGSRVIEIFRIPNDYCHHNEFMLEYKYYYNEYGDIEFKIISPKEWIYYKE